MAEGHAFEELEVASGARLVLELEQLGARAWIDYVLDAELTACSCFHPCIANVHRSEARVGPNEPALVEPLERLLEALDVDADVQAYGWR